MSLALQLPAFSEPFNMPDSMHPEDRAFLVRELGKISKELAVSSERRKQLEARLTKLEEGAERSGAHKAIQLQAEIDKRDLDMERWRARVWGIVAVLITSALVGLITHWLATQ